MTMPYGSTEEPMIEKIETQAFPIHVASSDLKPGKTLAAEFGQWRTLVLPVGGGAQRLLNRNLSRRQARFWVIANTLQSSANTGGPIAAPAANTVIVGVPSSGVLPAGTYTVTWSVELEGTVTQGTDDNNFQLRANSGAFAVNSVNPAAAGKYDQQTQTITLTSPGTIVIRNNNAGTAGSFYSASITATPLFTNTSDGIILGTKEVLSNVGSPASPVGTPGNGGGFMPVGTDPRVENQQELWCAPAIGNNDTVYVTVLDEVYASQPDDYRHNQGLG